MNVRVIIDRIALEGFTLAPGERERLETGLRETLAAALVGRLVKSRARRESRMASTLATSIVVPADTVGGCVGRRLGSALVAGLFPAGGAPVKGDRR